MEINEMMKSSLEVFPMLTHWDTISAEEETFRHIE